MKKSILFLLVFMTATLFTFGQKVSDATMGTYNNTYIKAGIDGGIRANSHNTFNKYIIASKAHKDSLDNVRILNDTTLEVTYKSVKDTMHLAAENYWYLSGDTIRTIYPVKLDSAFLMKYNDWYLGLVIEGPYDNNMDTTFVMGKSGTGGTGYLLFGNQDSDSSLSFLTYSQFGDTATRITQEYDYILLESSSASQSGKIRIQNDSTVITGQIFVPDIAASGTKYSGNVAGIGMDDRLFPKSITDLYDEMQDTIGQIPTDYTTWLRDTTNGYLYPAHADWIKTDYITNSDDNTILGHSALFNGFTPDSVVSSTFIGYNAGTGADTVNGSILFHDSGINAKNIYGSSLIGVGVGYEATNISLSTLIGNQETGYQSDSIFNSIAIGSHSAMYGNDIDNSILLGNYTGMLGNNIDKVNLIGFLVGQSLTDSRYSTFIGNRAGMASIRVDSSIVIGNDITPADINNQLWIDNNCSSAPLIEGHFDTDSLIVNGDLTVTGNLTYDFMHLVAYTSGGSYTPNTVSNTEFKLEPTFTTSENDGFTFAGDTATIITPGDYFVQFSVSFQGANGSDWLFKCRKNGTAITSGNLALTTTGAGNYCSGVWFWYLTGLVAGDDISFSVTNEGGSDDPTFRSVKIYIKKEPE